MLSRHEDVLRAAVDTATYSSAQGLTVEYGELEKIGLADNPPMVMLDPPEHTAFRRLVSRGFTPRAVREVEPEVRAYVAEKLDTFVAAGGGDIVVELFKPLPSMVVAHYLGVPAEDRDRFDGWTDAIVAAGSPGHPTDAAEATTAMLGYFAELIERRRREPAQDRGSDTVSHLVAAGVGRRRRRAAQHPRLRLRDGDRRQRHHHGRTRWGRAAARRAPRPARAPRRRPDPGQGRGRGVPPAHLTGAGRWPAPPLATWSCTA